VELNIEVMTDDALPHMAQVHVVVTTRRHQVMLPLTTQWCLQWGRSLSGSSSCEISINRRIVKDTADTCMTTMKTCKNSSWNIVNR